MRLNFWIPCGLGEMVAQEASGAMPGGFWNTPGRVFDFQNGSRFGVKNILKLFPACAKEVPKMGPDFDYHLCCFFVISGAQFDP